MLPLPENPGRLQALRDLEILDTPSEKVYEDLVTLAAQLCGTSIAVICLVDEKRLWFKAQVGLSPQELLRENGFCDHTILEDQPLIVEDARLDSRFSQNSLVTRAPFIRFYAGAPLILSSGHRVGTLAAIDPLPKKFTVHQLNHLSTLSRQVVALLEHRNQGILLHAALQTIERQRIQITVSSRLSTLGEIAAGVAHEINNPLGVIVARAGQLIEQAKSNTCSLDMIETSAKSIENTGQKIAEIVRSILCLAREEPDAQQKEYSLLAIYKNTIELCRERIQNEHIQFHFDPPDADLQIRCNETLMSQVISNLIHNAIDAIQHLPSKWIALQTEVEPGWVNLSVTDSGNGVPEPLQKNLKLPFFTTKAMGRGTGLGLAISEKIVNAHGGILTYDPSAPNTRFTARLPRSPGKLD